MTIVSTILRLKLLNNVLIKNYCRYHTRNLAYYNNSLLIKTAYKLHDKAALERPLI